MSDSDRARLQALEVAALRAELEETRRTLRLHRFRECDIPACNCGSWHAPPNERAERAEAERDASRRWARAWRKAAVYWRNENHLAEEFRANYHEQRDAARAEAAVLRERVKELEGALHNFCEAFRWMDHGDPPVSLDEANAAARAALTERQEETESGARCPDPRAHRRKTPHSCDVPGCVTCNNPDDPTEEKEETP
jgi:hypothetical protein